MPKRDYSIIKTLLNILCYQLLDVNYVLINLQDLDRHFDRNIYSNVIFPKGWKSKIIKIFNSIYLLTGYEGIASLLSLRHWQLTEAKPRSIVRVEGTTNLLFPNTVYKYFIMPKNIRLIVEWSPQNDKDQ